MAAGHGSLGIFPVVFFTTGALPTGLSSNTLYWATYINATTFHVSTTIANAVAGTYINTSGTQSGTQSAVLNAPVTGSNQDVAAIILTPGQWGIWGGLSWISSSGTSTNSSIWLNNVSATRPTSDLTAVDSLLNSQQTFGFNQAGNIWSAMSPQTRRSLSGIIAGTSGWVSMARSSRAVWDDSHCVAHRPSARYAATGQMRLSIAENVDSHAQFSRSANHRRRHPTRGIQAVLYTAPTGFWVQIMALGARSMWTPETTRCHWASCRVEAAIPSRTSQLTHCASRGQQLSRIQRIWSGAGAGDSLVGFADTGAKVNILASGLLTSGA